MVERAKRRTRSVDAAIHVGVDDDFGTGWRTKDVGCGAFGSNVDLHRLAHAGHALERVPVEGRRTTGLELKSSLPRDVGDYFARCAELEAISVHAFVRLAAEVRARGAPEALARRAVIAAEDEVRHTRAMTGLARAY